MKYLIAVDLEGIHGVVGEENKTLTAADDYKRACEGAALEINATAEVLFECGAEKVAVWDNHGGGNNIDFDLVDKRCLKIVPERGTSRYAFVKEHNFDAIIFLGYHAMEGTPHGVLAHTFSSVGIQYVKLNGRPIGELFVDSYIAASYGITPFFIAADNVCLAEMRTVCPGIPEVTTKIGIRRNRAELIDRECVLAEIRATVRRACAQPLHKWDHTFEPGSHLEVRYTRAERADMIYDRERARGEIPTSYGGDTHTLIFTVDRADQIPKLL